MTDKKKWRSPLPSAALLLVACGGSGEVLPPDGGATKIADAAAIAQSAELESEEDGGTPADSGADASVLQLDEEDVENVDPAGLKELAAMLKDRRMRVALREREVVRREQLLADLETAVIRKSAELTKIKVEVAALMDELRHRYRQERSKYEVERLKRSKERTAAQKELDLVREKRIVHLVATIKGMRAASGAGLLASMEEKDSVEVLRQLGPRQAAALLGGMPPNQGAKLAQAMLGPRTISSDFIEELPAIDDIDKQKGEQGSDAGVNAPR